jgi:5-(carboxyamino)imidazole ribonucleotide mutase
LALYEKNIYYRKSFLILQELKMENPIVAVIMGSKSDFEIVKGAFDVLKKFDIPYAGRVLSAHRTPVEAAEFAETAEEKGIKIIICAAGMAAHLAGVVAGHTTLPVIGIPVPSAPFNGIDSTLATMQMPPGIPVATVTAGKAGGKNAALLAVEMLAIGDKKLAAALKEFRAAQREDVLAADKELQSMI